MGQPHIAGLQVGWGAIFALVNLIGGGAVGIWLRSRGAWLKNQADADERVRSEMWKDIASLKLGKEETSRRLTLAETRIAQQTVQIGQQRFILALVIDELERVNPGNSVARQARFLMQSIQPDAMPEPEEVAPMAETIATLNSMG